MKNNLYNGKICNDNNFFIAAGAISIISNYTTTKKPAYNT